MNNFHTPVLLAESLEYLIGSRAGIYFDGTLGFGGHSEGILKLLDENAKLISTDVDTNAFEHSKKKFSNDSRMKIYNFNFQKIDVIAKIESIKAFDGIFADLGVSSYQLDSPSAGFTYRQDAKLDLRMDKSIAVNAADIINSYSEEDIANLIYKYGEEKNSRKIASKICEKRTHKKIETTFELSEIISEITSQRYLIKTLSRVFQALRIYVNDELDILKSFISKAVELLKQGGRIVILSYHSLEDRIVKDAFRFEALDCVCPKDYPVCRCDKVSRLKILTKKPVLPSEDEIMKNPRARSAKLRAAERI
jgi:16S rRNA (cytosine1402-N4)-methyltransferase